MQLPQDILHRSERVYAYHLSTRLLADTPGGGIRPPDWSSQPTAYRVFEGYPEIALPTTLPDLPAPTQVLLRDGLDGLPDSQVHPPQDVKTLATWLYMTYGMVKKLPPPQGAPPGRTLWLRPTPSASLTYPCEIYVAAFAIEGLEPGLYHFCPRTFSLYRLRDCVETLYHMKRGRPDLEFLKTIPVALLVSTIYCRSSWRYGHRAYRHALIDTGHLVQGLLTVGTGLGMTVAARLRLNDTMTRELIGLAPDAGYDQAESVQAMVAWTDLATNPIALPNLPPGSVRSLDPIPRAPLAPHVVDYPTILSVHRECVAPGLGRIEMRPPTTELSPIPGSQIGSSLAVDEMEGGLPLRQVLLASRPADDFARGTISRHHFAWFNRLAFRAGTHYPITPDGSHVGLVRPFWIVNDITGMDSGVWYYNVKTDRWVVVQLGEFRMECRYLALDRPAYARASAVCLLAVALPLLLKHVGPDVYRLAHLEAGLACQRLYLCAGAMGFAWSLLDGVYADDAVRFLGLAGTGWEIVAGCAIGLPPEADSPTLPAQEQQRPDWRG